MARVIHSSRKLRMAKLGRQARWAPFWIVNKIHGPGRKIHPGRHTVIKRHWRRTKMKA